MSKCIAVIKLIDNNALQKIKTELLIGIDCWLIGDWKDSANWAEKLDELKLAELEENSLDLMRLAVKKTNKIVTGKEVRVFIETLEMALKDSASVRLSVSKFVCSELFLYYKELSRLVWLTKKYDEVEVWIDEDWDKWRTWFEEAVPNQLKRNLSKVSWVQVNKIGQRTKNYKGIASLFVSLKCQMEKKNNIRKQHKYDLGIYIDPRANNYWFETLPQKINGLAKEADFYVNNDRFKGKSFVFIFPTKPTNAMKNFLKSKNYEFIYLGHTVEKLRVSLVVKRLKLRSLYTFIKFVYWWSGQSLVWQDLAVNILKESVLWNCLLNEYQINKVVVSDDYSYWGQGVKKIVLNYHDSKLLWVLPTHSFIVDQEDYISAEVFSFLNYDTTFLWGERAQNYLAEGKSNLGNVKLVGVTGSSRVAKWRDTIRVKNLPILSKLMEESFGERHLVTIFDERMASIYSARIKENAMMILEYLEDAINLAKKHSNYVFVIKPKYDPDSYFFNSHESKIADLWHALWKEVKNINNIVMVDHRIDSALLIALSELVISPGYASPTWEAIMANVPGLYHTPRAKKVLNILSKVKRVASTNYSGLETNFNYWTKKTKVQEELKRVQNKLFQIDSYADAKADDRIIRDLIYENK